MGWQAEERFTQGGWDDELPFCKIILSRRQHRQKATVYAKRPFYCKLVIREHPDCNKVLKPATSMKSCQLDQNKEPENKIFVHFEWYVFFFTHKFMHLKKHTIPKALAPRT